MKRLPDAELEVMQAVWSCESPVQRKEIEEILDEQHPMALTTLLTLLARLEKKGFLTARKNGRRSEYIPLISRREYQAQESRSFLDRVFYGSVSEFAAALSDSGISDEDLQELKELLERGKL